jgi:hypothetical protein
MSKMVLKNFKLKQETEAEILMALILHNGRSHGPKWNFSDFVRNACERYLLDLARGQKHSRARTKKKKAKKLLTLIARVGQEGTTQGQEGASNGTQEKPAAQPSAGLRADNGDPAADKGALGRRPARWVALDVDDGATTPGTHTPSP